MVGGRASFKDYFENIMTEQQRKDWLGPERYKLWKSGKYKFDDFVTPWPNRGVTVDMLKKADKAGLGVSPNGQQYQVSKDALAFAQTKIAQNVDATGLSSKSLDAITHRLADKMKKYGIEKFEDFLPTDNERAILGVSSDNKTFAFYAQTWNDIVENPRKTYRQSKGRPGELMQYAFDDPKNVISHCIDHELGHMIFNKSSVQNKDKMLLDLYLNNNFGHNLSQYAKKSPREFFAENFAIYERGGTLEPDIYNFIMEIIK